MKIKELIDDLNEITKTISDPDSIEVEFADCLPITKPILKDRVIYITDVENY